MSTEAEIEKPSAEPPSRWTLRPLLLRLHFYAGILVGPFILIAALTGLLYIFSPQLDEAIYDHELHVTPETTSVALSEQVAAAEAELPDSTLSAVRPSPSPTDTTQVIFSTPGLAESYFHTVFVNPYDGEIRGVLETYGSGQALPVRAWLDQLHRGLHLGDVGRLYSELAASWLWVVVLGGLVLWWGRRRRKRLVPDRTATGRRRTLSWHGVTGTWVALALLFLSATGLTWSQFAGQRVTDLRSSLSWETPTVSASAGEHAEHGATGTGTGTGDGTGDGTGEHSGHGEHGDHGDHGAGADAPDMPVTNSGIDRVLAAARSEGFEDPVEIRPPSGEGEVYVVQRVPRVWPSAQDAAAIDPNTAQVLEVVHFDDWPLMAKLARWGVDAHMGLLFGLPNQLVLTAVCLAVITLVVLGYRMWWQRRPTKDAGFALARPFPRGGWRRVPPWALALLTVAAVFVGWFLPLLGVSLAGFLIIDALLAARKRRQTAARR
ncbi:PepSY-associated TM helix domain-containing protein [Prauserella cavernicola]|uniref:PepSY domain-containing protein n=1 Tax=Prauserella cavernicola TaxID=2800127 RepID=A0A934R0Q9_9PSEU|nr:PepSY domain-containing protein [Prauserella cavernicola]MBK1788723.1 PepSY domain-containing protein [Prauserella cavernicola]